MLGFPPPLFFQICWRFVSPAIIFVSFWSGPSLPAAPLASVLLLGTSRGSLGAHPSGQSSPTGSPLGGATGSLKKVAQNQVETQNHPGTGLGVGRELRAFIRLKKADWWLLRAGPPSCLSPMGLSNH